MTSTIHKTPKSTTKQSLFFNDLATPVTTRRSASGKFSNSGQSAAVSALWRENFASSDLPPPPVFTLEDRSDFSPDSEFPVGSPEHNNNINNSLNLRTPARTPSVNQFSTSPNNNNNNNNKLQSPAASLSWWSGGGRSESVGDDKAKAPGSGSGAGSPVDGVVHRQQGALLTLPPPREVARPDTKRNFLPVGSVDEEEWVTVFGFSPADTNIVLREFEKCGVILKHILGPRDSNWMHILYQSRFDAQKALSKNGMHLNGALIIGVKPVDPMQRQSLSDKLHNQGFTPIPPTTAKKPDPIAFNTSTRSHNQSPHSGGTMASPAKSVVSKIVDLMFGL